MINTVMPTAGELSALRLSLIVAASAVTLTAAPGIAVGWLLARKDFPGKALVDAVVHLPLVLPPVVVGYLLLMGIGQRSPFGRFVQQTLGMDLAFTWHAAVLASAVMGFPLLVRAVRLSVELVDVRLEQAAITLGAHPLWRWLTVTLPLSLPGVATGMVLAFARSLGEFGATITFAGNIPGKTRTLPLAIFTHVQVPGEEGSALRLVIISVAVSLAALVVSELLARRAKRLVGSA